MRRFYWSDKEGALLRHIRKHGGVGGTRWRPVCSAFFLLFKALLKTHNLQRVTFTFKCNKPSNQAKRHKLKVKGINYQNTEIQSMVGSKEKKINLTILKWGSKF